MGSSLSGNVLDFELPCLVMGRGFLPRTCIYGPVAAHPLGAISV